MEVSGLQLANQRRMWAFMTWMAASTDFLLRCGCCFGSDQSLSPAALEATARASELVPNLCGIQHTSVHSFCAIAVPTQHLQGSMPVMNHSVS